MSIIHSGFKTTCKSFSYIQRDEKQKFDKCPPEISTMFLRSLQSSAKLTPVNAPFNFASTDLHFVSQSVFSGQRGASPHGQAACSSPAPTA
jgi:hypothetical protein